MRIRKWTILLGLSITVLFGLVLPLAFNNKDAAVAVEYQKKKEAAMESFKEELILSASVPASDSVLASDTDTDTVTGTDTVTITGTDTITTSNTGTDIASNTGTAPAEVATEEIRAEETPLGTVQGTEVKDTWVQAQIDENRDAIDSSDLDRGAEIYNSLDTRYIFGLADGGLTDEERAEVDIYLKSQLNGSDYDLAKQLYFKYVGLLNE